MEIMAGLPRRPEVGDVFEVERDELHVELRYVEGPFPLVAEEGEESPVGCRIKIIHHFGGCLLPARADLFVVVAQRREEWRRAKQLWLRVNQRTVALRAVLYARAAESVQARYVVSGGQQQMGLVALQRVERGLAVCPVADDGHAQLVGRIGAECIVRRF